MKVIVVGAGASGLMAAYELTRNGVEVVLLEAENRIGGRIETVTPPGFIHQVEAGAEFVHGNVPITLRLFKQAGLTYFKASRKMFRGSNGRIQPNFGNGKHWNDFFAELAKVRQNLTLESFIDRHFSDRRYARLRQEIHAMAQGMDLADPAQLSVLGIKREWLSDQPHYRPTTGYESLIRFLYDRCTERDFELLLNQTVQSICWEKGSVKAITQNNSYDADAILLTLPVWSYHSNSISFAPTLTVQEHFREIGYGNVVKMALEFDRAFWEVSHPDLGFLFVDEFTFWTQLDLHKPFLTAWIGNQFAENLSKRDDSALLQLALDKLESCFGIGEVRKIYRAGAVFRFTNGTPIGGGYSWLKPQSKKAISVLKKGVENTIWFAGEALHPGAVPGTVESALKSGRYAARKILGK